MVPIIDLVGHHDGDRRQFGEARIVGRKGAEWQVGGRGQLVFADGTVADGLPVDPWVVFALIVDAAPPAAEMRVAGKSRIGEIFRIAGKAATGTGQRGAEIGGAERGVLDWLVAADLGAAVDDRVRAVRVALCLRPRALCAAGEEREVIGLRRMIDAVRIGKIRMIARLRPIVAPGGLRYERLVDHDDE